MKETTALIGSDNAFSHTFDVRDRAAWDEALEAFVAVSGRMDVLANNDGIPIGGSIIENSEDEITRCLDINLKGVLFGAQAAHPYLKATAPGSCLLNTASAAGRPITSSNNVLGTRTRATTDNGRRAKAREARASST